MKIMKIVTSRFLLLLNVFFISHQINATHFDLVTKIKKHKFKIVGSLVAVTGFCFYLRHLNDKAFETNLDSFNNIISQKVVDVIKAKKTIECLIDCSKSWFCSSSNKIKFKDIEHNNQSSFYFPKGYYD